MNKRSGRWVSAVVVCIVFTLTGSLWAREKRGASLIITFKDGHFAEGELIAVKPDSLLLLAGRDESVALAEIRSVRVVRKSQALVGGLCGLAAGVTLAACIAGDTDLGPFSPFADLAAAVTLIPSGIGLGAGAGALAGKDKIIRLEGMTEPQVRVALAYLRKKARVQKPS